MRPDRGDSLTLYLAGPMSGIAEFNAPAFDAATAAWRAVGFKVYNPVEHDRDDMGVDHTLYHDGDVSATQIPYTTFLREAVKAVASCEAIAMLPGWQASNGANLELYVARALEMPAYDARYPDDLKLIQENVLEEAMRIVYGDRAAAYGHPKENFRLIAKLMMPIIDARIENGRCLLRPQDVALLMVQTKVARELNITKRDNWTDIAGYAGAGARAIGLDD